MKIPFKIRPPLTNVTLEDVMCQINSIPVKLQVSAKLCISVLFFFITIDGGGRKKTPFPVMFCLLFGLYVKNLLKNVGCCSWLLTSNS